MATDRRDGFALAIAMFAIVVIGAIIAGAFFASGQEYRVGRNTITQARAMGAAEAGQASVLARWNSAWNSSLPIGQATGWVDVPVNDGSGSAARANVTRLDQVTFWLVSEGAAGGTSVQTGSRRRTGSVLRLAIPQMNFLGALTTRGTTQIGGSSYINGNDAAPTGWTCPAAGPAMPGIAIDDATKIVTSGCNNLDCVSGDPKVLQTAEAADDATYFDYETMGWSELVAMATLRFDGSTNLQNLGPTTSGGACNVADTKNWGEPKRNSPVHPCESYYPIIYVNGDMTLNTGRGQGILLVEGDLLVQGGFEFFGPVIVKGKLQTAGTGGHFNGGVMAANVDLETNTVLGNAVVNYSSCALLTVLSNTSMPKLATARGWADLF
ncbi:MAG TPA: hypothetical protein VMM18_03290 [Gemmatimonadaceae bacterium]|nr:hypothetical protein [Gemmatimonadaceae bacterium]